MRCSAVTASSTGFTTSSRHVTKGTHPCRYPASVSAPCCARLATPRRPVTVTGGTAPTSTAQDRRSDVTDEERKAKAAKHLNNAIAASYQNAGPSAVLVDIRAALVLLDMAEVQCDWVHWNARGE